MRRVARAMARRGNAGRKRKRGRPNKAQQAPARAAAGPSNKGEKAGFISKHRFLIVKKSNELTEQQWTNLRKMFGLPGPTCGNVAVALRVDGGEGSVRCSRTSSNIVEEAGGALASRGRSIKKCLS